jgi:hypothetical protein
MAASSNSPAVNLPKDHELKVPVTVKDRSTGVAAVTSVRRVCAGKPTLLVAGSFT